MFLLNNWLDSVESETLCLKMRGSNLEKKKNLGLGKCKYQKEKVMIKTKSLGHQKPIFLDNKICNF